MAVKVMSSNDVKQRWGQVMREVTSPDDAVIVESHGKPKVAVISIERLERSIQLETQQRREIGLRAIRDIEEAYDGRNDELSEDEIEELAVRAARESGTDLLTILGLAPSTQTRRK